MPLLSLRDVSFTFSEPTLLDGITIEIEKGQREQRSCCSAEKGATVYVPALIHESLFGVDGALT